MRFWLSSCGQAAAISCSGRGVVAMVNFPGTAACSISPVAASSCDTDRLPIPLPISRSGAERSTAPFNAISAPAREPTCT